MRAKIAYIDISVGSPNTTTVYIAHYRDGNRISSKTYFNITPASIKRCQRAQLALLEAQK